MPFVRWGRLFSLILPLIIRPIPARKLLPENPPARQELLSEQVLELFCGQGIAIFVSHQWVGTKHPDPQMKHLGATAGERRPSEENKKDVDAGQVVPIRSHREVDVCQGS